MRTNSKGSSDSLASFQGCPGIGIGGNLHSDEARDNRGDGSNQEGDGGKDAIVKCRSMLDSCVLVDLPFGGEAILRAEQHKDDDGENCL